MIGDPSFKTSDRVMLDEETLRHNEKAITTQVKQILENLKSLSGYNFKFEVMNNYDFYKNMNVFDFLKTAGKYITVNNMLNKESVKKRIEDPEMSITYTEFSYMLLQGYDFLTLYEKYKVKLQIG
jgi:tyrosyl-tRNA synthetase